MYILFGSLVAIVTMVFVEFRFRLCCKLMDCVTSSLAHYVSRMSLYYEAGT
jgi:hypothetical protein